MSRSFADEIIAVLMTQAPEGSVLNGALVAAIVAKCNDIPRKVWAVYADYDAEAPDTKDLIFCATEQVAKDVCADLNRDPRSHNDLAYVEGCEGCKTFRFRQTWVGPNEDVCAICKECSKLKFAGKEELVSLEEGLDEWTIEKVQTT